jgi:hypothetical protein
VVGGWDGGGFVAVVWKSCGGGVVVGGGSGWRIGEIGDAQNPMGLRPPKLLASCGPCSPPDPLHRWGAAPPRPPAFLGCCAPKPPCCPGGGGRFPDLPRPSAILGGCSPPDPVHTWRGLLTLQTSPGSSNATMGGLGTTGQMRS